MTGFLVGLNLSALLVASLIYRHADTSGSALVQCHISTFALSLLPLCS